MLLPLLLLLGCSPLALADTPPGHNEDTPGGLWDDCDYTSALIWRCGDICANRTELCECGDITLRSREFIPTQHCCTSTSCTQGGGDVSCPGGQVRNISGQCEDGRCYGDYNSSQSLDYFRSSYSCSGDQKDCLPLPDMCAGLSSCGDNQVCNEELRCDDYNGVEIINLNTSKVQHSYCQYPAYKGDRSYSSIDRSDENITNTINIKESPKIDFSYLTPCNDSDTGPGVTCTGLSDTKRCIPVGVWCRSDGQFSCVTSQDGTLTASDDSRLCSNKIFWENDATDIYSGGVEGRGVRCSGSKMATIFPWYKSNFAGIIPGVKQNCDDYSDRVFASGKPCPNRTYYLGLHNSEWCSTKPTNPWQAIICTDPSLWLEGNQAALENLYKLLAPDQATLDDPHFCQESCATPGLNCEACTNEKYFICSRSNTCIHPDLKCDGHPQCPDYELCRNTLTRRSLNSLQASNAIPKCIRKSLPLQPPAMAYLNV